MSGSTRRLEAGALTLSLLLAGFAGGAGAIEIDSWRVTWEDQLGEGGQPVVLEDDFDDSDFPGFPAYVEPCGEVQPGDETGGTLDLGSRATDNAGCSGAQVASFGTTGAGDITARARFVFASPPEGQGYGLRLTNSLAAAFTDAVSITVLSGSGDVAIVVVDENGTFSQLTVLEPAFLAGLPPGSTLELQLVVAEDGGELIPNGRFRFNDAPFENLGPAPGSGALSAAELHGASLFALVPEPTTALLLGGGLAGLGALGRRRPQVTSS